MSLQEVIVVYRNITRVIGDENSSECYQCKRETSVQNY